ncbi:MAG: glycosyltransferase [Tannerellaceae bacterium]|jgi:glycosyltransferase involved in cell wall biosynthesis|nr:glycosyltransferase [Tannerellaceae bacterium]
MHTSPVFSVITVTYNAVHCLEETILSVLGQSYPGIEYLIVDGASTDGTVELIQSYASSLAWWTSRPDGSLYEAMNTGLQQATGDYVWFVNAGDRIHGVDTAREMADRICACPSPPDILYGETALIDSRGRFLGMRSLRSPKSLSWKSFRTGMRVSHQSFLVRRTLAPAFDLRYRFSSDVDWCIRCMKRSGAIVNTRLVLSDFLEGGLSTKRRAASLRERYHILCRYYGWPLATLLHGWFALRFLAARRLKTRV